MAQIESFIPAEGVTIENSVRYIAAVEEALINDFDKIEPMMRPSVLRAIKFPLAQCMKTLNRLIADSDMAKAMITQPPSGVVN